MIRLRRPAAPPELTLAKQTRLTATFLRNPQATVWNKTYIRATLEASSEFKCAYCERRLGAVQAMQVDHFRPKSNHPLLVVQWGNLIPACAKCNGRKSNFDVRVTPILNPYQDEPQEHLARFCFEIRGTTPLGDETVALLDLADLTEEHFRVYQQVSSFLRSVHALGRQIGSTPSLSRRSALECMAGLRAVLRRAQTSEIYSGTIASCLLRDPMFLEVETLLREARCWDQELQMLRDGAAAIALPTI